MTEKKRSRRSGGRAARHSANEDPSETKQSTTRGIESGALQTLSEVQKHKIHSAALDILESVGFGEVPDSTREYLTNAGCWMTDGGRICFPRSLVEDTIARARKSLTLFGQRPEHDIDVSGSKTYFSTGCGSIRVINPVTKDARPLTAKDVYDFARITDSLENIHMFHRLGTPTNIEDTNDVDINLCYAAVKGTSKPVSSSWFNGENVTKSIEMCHWIAGDEKRWRARPFVLNTCTFVVPPLKFAPEACEGFENAIRGGMPVQLTSSGQQGATAPVTVGGTIVQTIAEVLGGLVYAYQISDNPQVLLGTWPMVSDLRTGAATIGSPEQGIASSVSSQIARYYGLPNGTVSGGTDSKLPDTQSGYEKALQHTLVGNSGGNVLFCAAGALAGGLGCSHAGLAIDNEIIGGALRSIVGFELNDEELAVDVIREVCIKGPGHYLGRAETLARMKKDFFYPTLSDRSSLNDWMGSNKPTMLENAIDYVDNTLANYFPDHISDNIDQEIRQHFDILLAENDCRQPAA